MGVDKWNSTTNGEGDYWCQTVSTRSVSDTRQGEGRCILWFSCAIVGTQEVEKSEKGDVENYSH